MHGRCATKYLTGAIPRPFGQEGSDFRADISLDQLLANELGRETQLGSLELSLESGDKGAGTCDGGYSCTYSHTLSWRGPTTPLPMEHNPRVVFERMFGDGGSTDPAAAGGAPGERPQPARLGHPQDCRAAPRPRSQRCGQADRVSGCRAGHRAPHPARRAAGGPRAAGVRPAGGGAARVRGSRAPDVRSAGARVPERSDARHHLHGRPRVQQPHLPGDRRAGRPPPAVARAQPPKASGSSPPSTCTTPSRWPTTSIGCSRRPTATARSSITCCCTTAPACARATTSRGTSRSCWWAAAPAGSGAGGTLRYPDEPPLANLHLTVLEKFGMRMDRIHDSTGRLDLA